MNSFIFLSLLVGMLFVFGAQSATVTREKRSTACASTKACLTPFPMLEEFVAKDNIKGLYAVSYETVLDQLCTKKNALHTCLDNARCPDVEISYTGTGVRRVLDYICDNDDDDNDEGRSRGSRGRAATLLSESKCFARDSFEAGFKLCSKALESEMSALAVNVQLGFQDASSFCPQFTKYFKCVENEVQNSCSSAAADFVTSLTAAMYEPLASRLGCRIEI